MGSTHASEHPVRVARLKLGLRLVDVATLAECSAPLISMVESGYTPKPATRDRIARALKTDVATLWPAEQEGS